ncbi:MAG: electron transport complex subunit RsxC [Candidatus Accumulibacter sp.]|jgi:electron transport complex protein RnfC|nr:electron transport complex subunit RsxC [Accumulibacter sp.]
MQSGLSRKLFRFKGGVEPDTHKAESAEAPIRKAPLPSRLILPLHQSVGARATPCVRVGETLRKGQRIGNADGWISAAVHAPTSGKVLAIEDRPAAHPSGLPTLSVVIEPDGLDTWIERAPLDLTARSPDEVCGALRDAGIVGLGGAVFPTHAKLSAAKSTAIDEVVINGAECEPFMTCDDFLMRERAEDVVRGASIFRDLLEPKRVLIGIEDNKPEAARAMRRAVEALGFDFEVVVVPTRYPTGAAKQLIRVLTGKEIPSTRRSPEMGVQCFNVGTAYSAWRFVAFGEPLISRIVTLTGNVESAGNWETLIGTPFEEFVALGRPKPDTERFLMGGPMMGFEIPDLSAPVVKACNCVIAASLSLFPPPPPEMPCIRCGACAEVCPHELQPFELYRFSRAQKFDKAVELSIDECIKCGCCAYVCPSRIPLVQYFRFAKSEIDARRKEKAKADATRARVEQRKAREERLKAEKAERLAAAVKTSGAGGGDGADAAKKALIAAAAERARLQREAHPPKNPETAVDAEAAEKTPDPAVKPGDAAR